jgi:hypothetical protein
MGKRVPLGACIFLAPLFDVARHQGEAGDEGLRPLHPISDPPLCTACLTRCQPSPLLA